MSKCRVCEGRAQLFLCLTHITTLRETLHDLPWWLDKLDEAAVGQVRMSDPGRRSTRAHELDEFTGPDGAEKLDKARKEGRFDIDVALAGGRVNGKASRLADEAANGITTWVRHLCESRGIEPPKMDTRGCVAWLEKRTHAIASDEAAKECHDWAVDLTDSIRRTVNRGEGPRFCGPCTTTLTDEQRAKLMQAGEDDRTQCRTQLYAKRGVSLVTCPACRTEHDVGELQRLLMEEVSEYSFTISDLSDFVLPKLGIEVSRRKLQRMAVKGDLGDAGESGGVARYQLSTVKEAVSKRRAAQ